MGEGPGFLSLGLAFVFLVAKVADFTGGAGQRSVPNVAKVVDFTRA